MANAVDADDALLTQVRDELSTVRRPHELNNLKSRYLGKTGAIRRRLSEVRQLPPAERAAAGRAINALRDAVETLIESKKQELAAAEVAAQTAERTDVTLPGRSVDIGALHPITLTINRLSAILREIGFEVVDGPEIETDYYNFTALNQPPDHPARSMHDTFYLSGTPHLLRTHTSPVQVRYMEKNVDNLPLRAISPGRVYRRDHDATHSPIFHQIEGIWVDDRVRFTDLKGVLGALYRAFFADPEIEIRFRPSFFPFTEPSAEFDIRRRGGQWLEVGGCGMIHPNVLRASGIAPESYRGFAFGTGVERMAMLYYGIDDIRLFYENDVHFLRQFGR